MMDGIAPMAAPKERTEGPEPAPEQACLFCPVCSARLAPRKCKLICTACGYYMSCSDYYWSAKKFQRVGPSQRHQGTFSN